MAGNVLMVIAKEGFRDEEYLEPKSILEKLGHLVTTASDSEGPCHGKLGAKAYSELALRDARAEDYGAAVFVGGPGASAFFDDHDALRIAKDAYSSGKVVAAICIAPSILANAGILDGKKATAYPSEKENLLAKGASYTDEMVCQDGKVITANGPDAARGFGERIAKALG